MTIHQRGGFPEVIPPDDPEMRDHMRGMLRMVTPGTLKLSIEVGVEAPTRPGQKALEYMLVHGWLRLIDISHLASGNPVRLYRVFVADPAAVAWANGEEV